MARGVGRHLVHFTHTCGLRRLTKGGLMNVCRIPARSLWNWGRRQLVRYLTGQVLLHLRLAIPSRRPLRLPPQIGYKILTTTSICTCLRLSTQGVHAPGRCILDICDTSPPCCACYQSRVYISTDPVLFRQHQTSRTKRRRCDERT